MPSGGALLWKKCFSFFSPVDWLEISHLLRDGIPPKTVHKGAQIDLGSSPGISAPAAQKKRRNRFRRCSGKFRQFRGGGEAANADCR